MAKGFGTAGLVFALLGIFFPFGIILSVVAICLAIAAGLMGDRALAASTSLVVLVNTFVLSPSVWIVLAQAGSGLGWLFVIGALLPFGAIALNASGGLAVDSSTAPVSPPTSTTISRETFGPAVSAKAEYDVAKWNALVKYDPEIGQVAEKLRPLGSKWVDTFAADYLALNDKIYLPEIVQKIIQDARAESEAQERQRRQDEENQAEMESERERLAELKKHEDARKAEARKERIRIWKVRLWGTPLRKAGCATIILLCILAAAAPYFIERAHQEAIRQAALEEKKRAALEIQRRVQEREQMLRDFEETQRQILDEERREAGVAPADFRKTSEYTSQFPEKHAVLMAEYRRMVPGYLRTTPWINDLNGTAGPLIIVSLRGKHYFGGSICKPHDCADNRLTFLVAVDGSRAVAVLRTAGDYYETFGDPITDELSFLKRMFDL